MMTLNPLATVKHTLNKEVVVSVHAGQTTSEKEARFDFAVSEQKLIEPEKP